MTKPYDSRGYVSWVEDADATKYIIEVFQAVYDSSGVTYRSKLTQSLNKNYVKLDHDISTKPNTFYQVKGYNESSDVVSETPILSVNPYVPDDTESYTEACGWVCDGTTYAWELVMWQNPDGNSSKLVPKIAYDYFDNETQQAVPYFEAMTEAVYESRYTTGVNVEYSQAFADKCYFRTEVGVNEGVKDKDGNPLNMYTTDDPIYFCGKRMDYMDPLSTVYTDELTFNYTECVEHRGWARIRYNQESYHTNDPLPLEDPNDPSSTIYLDCEDAYWSSSGNTTSPNDIASGDNVDFNYYWIECVGFSYYVAALTLQDALEGTPCGTESGYQSWSPINPTGGSDIVAMQVRRIDEPGEVVNLDPEKIFDVGDPYVAQDHGFETGLYQVFYSFGDGTTLPMVLEYNEAEDEPSSNADFANLEIYPNPIQNSKLEFKVSVERKMVFDIRVMALDGTVLLNERAQMDANTDLSRSIKVPETQYPYDQLRVKLIFQDGSSLDEIALRQHLNNMN